MNVFELMARLSLDTKDYDSSLDSSEKKASSFGSNLKSALSTAGKISAGAIGAVTTAVIGTGTALVNSVTQLSQYGDNIDKTSQKLGLSAEAYQEWSVIMQHSGTSIDSMTAAFRTLGNSVESGSASFEALGISLEDAASMSREDLFSATISALQGVEDANERAALAQDLLGRSAMELGPLLNTSAEDTEAMRQRVHELGGVLSDEAVKSSAAYQDSLLDMNVALSGVKNSMLSEFLPSMTTVIDGLTEVFGGDSDKGIGLINDGISSIAQKITQALPKVIQVGSKIISSLLSAMMTALPELISMGATIITTIADALIQNVDSLIDAAVEILNSVIKALPELIQALVTKIPEIIQSIATAWLEASSALLDAIVQVVQMLAEMLASPDAITSMIESALTLMLGLVDGILEAIPQIIAAIPSIITGIISGLLAAIPQIMEAGVSLLTSLVSALPQIIQSIVKAIPEIIKGIVTAVTAALPEIINAGITLFVSLIEALPEIINTIIDGLDEIIVSILDALIEATPQLIDAGVMLFLALIENLPEIIAGIVEAVVSIGENILTSFEDWGPKLMEWASTLWDSFRGAIVEVWDGIKAKASEIWENIKDAIEEPIEEARDKVKEVIEKIKGFFDFDWSLPPLKMPHLTVTGSFSLNPPKVPSFSIDWYARAMNDGMILNGATIFGMGKNGNLLGGGEVGSEVVVGTNSLMDMIKEAIGGERVGTNIVINVYPREGQDEESIAEYVMERLNLEMDRQARALA